MKKEFTRKQNKIANKIVKLFNCYSYEPEVCELCEAVRKLVTKFEK